MARIPLFLHSPVSDSVLQALPFIETGEEFHFHQLKLDPDFFTLMIDVRPCVAVFSIPGPEETRKVCSLLEAFRLTRTSMGYPSRDPTLRIILVAEQRAVAIERWHELGVHEFIIAPILPRALAYKVQRHHQRAVTGRIPEPVLEQEDDIVVISAAAESTSSGPIPCRRIRTALAPLGEAGHEFRFAPPPSPADEERVFRETYEVIAAVPDLPGTSPGLSHSADSLDPRQLGGSWEKDPASGDSEVGVWDWVWNPPKDKLKSRSLKFRGQRPEYDPKRGAWRFLGEKPELSLKTETGEIKKLISVTDAENPIAKKELRVHESLDVHDVSRQSFVPEGDSHSAKKRGLFSKFLEKISEPNRSLKDDASPPSKEDARNITAGIQSSEGLSPSPSSQSSSKTYVEKGQRSSGKSSLSSSTRSASTQTGARTLISERGKERKWSSPSQGSGPEETPLKSSQSSAPDFSIHDQFRSATQVSGESETPSENISPEVEQPNLASPSKKEEALKDETSQDPSLDLESDPLIARLEAALLGKPDAPSDNLGPMKISSTPDEEGLGGVVSSTAPSEKSDLRGKSSATDDPLGYSQLRNTPNPFPTSESRIRIESEKKKEAGIQTAERASQDPKGKDLKLKESKDPETNTWSLQNLDETGGLGKSARPKKEAIPSENELIESLLRAKNEEAGLGTDPATLQAMDPAEKARLLKAIYASLNLKPQTDRSSENEKNQKSFFENLLEAIKALVRGSKS